MKGKYLITLVISSDLPQPLQYALPLHNILIIPLDLPPLLQPTLKIIWVYVCHICVSYFSCLELALFLQSRLIKRLSTPEHQVHPVLSLTITYNGIALQEPNGMTVPYLFLRFGQMPANFLVQEGRYFILSRRKRVMISFDIRRNVHSKIIDLIG